MMALIMVENLEDPLKTNIAGGSLLIQTKTSDQKNAMIIRGFNPQDSIVNHYDAEDLLTSLIEDYLGQLPQAHERIHLLPGAASGALSNRPSVIAAAIRLQGDRTLLGETIDFNGYDITENVFRISSVRTDTNRSEVRQMTQSVFDALTKDQVMSEAEALDLTVQVVALSRRQQNGFIARLEALRDEALKDAGRLSKSELQEGRSLAFGAQEYAEAVGELIERIRAAVSKNPKRALALGLVMPSDATRDQSLKLADQLKQLGVGQVLLGGAKDHSGLTGFLHRNGIQIDPAGLHRRDSSIHSGVGVVVRGQMPGSLVLQPSDTSVLISDTEKVGNPFVNDYTEVLQEAVALLYDLESAKAELLKNPVPLVIQYGLVSSAYQGPVAVMNGRNVVISALNVQRYLEWRAERQAAVSA